MDNISTTTTVVGWTVVVGAVILVYYVSNKDRIHDKINQTLAQRNDSINQPPDQGRKPMKGGKGGGKMKAPTKLSVPAESKTQSGPAPTSWTPKDEETEDMSWVHALAGKREGTKFTSTTKANNGPRTVKPSKMKRGNRQSPQSSNAGGDGDDDFTPATSPSLTAEDSGELPSGQDVSDMLEAPAAGPSVLRITEPNTPFRSQAPRKPKASTKEEGKNSKKNKKKAEEQKAMIQEAEKTRKALLEKQRQTARVGRGEAAKNGMATKAPTSNAWQDGATGSISGPTATHGQLLDTFPDDSTIQAGPASEASVVTSGKVNGSKNTKGTNESHWLHDLPSEEEQLERLKEMDESAWTKVKAGRGKKGANKAKAAESVIEDDSSEHSSDAPAVQAPEEEEEEELDTTAADYTENGKYVRSKPIPDSDWQTTAKKEKRSKY